MKPKSKKYLLALILLAGYTLGLSCKPSAAEPSETGLSKNEEKRALAMATQFYRENPEFLQDKWRVQIRKGKNGVLVVIRWSDEIVQLQRAAEEEWETIAEVDNWGREKTGDQKIWAFSGLDEDSDKKYAVRWTANIVQVLQDSDWVTLASYDTQEKKSLAAADCVKSFDQACLAKSFSQEGKCASEMTAHTIMQQFIEARTSGTRIVAKFRAFNNETELAKLSDQLSLGRTLLCEYHVRGSVDFVNGKFKYSSNYIGRLIWSETDEWEVLNLLYDLGDGKYVVNYPDDKKGEIIRSNEYKD